MFFHSYAKMSHLHLYIQQQCYLFCSKNNQDVFYISITVILIFMTSLLLIEDVKYEHVFTIHLDNRVLIMVPKTSNPQIFPARLQVADRGREDGEYQVHCMLKTILQDFTKEQASCSRYKRVHLASIPTYSYLTSCYQFFPFLPHFRIIFYTWLNVLVLNMREILRS